MLYKNQILLTSLLFSQLAISQTTLTVVDNYSKAGDESIWEKVKNDNVPTALLRKVSIGSPQLAYAGLFPKNFYQDENFIVCFRECSNSDSKSGHNEIEQQNVYYWLGKFYQMTKERFDLLPTKRMKVLTSRKINDPGTSKKMRNNAFFNPADGSLSFLPASANPLAALLGGRINRSGFDPSVVAHEAGHSLFHALFPNSINNEISGFNEGFADYLANILLEDSKVGMVMLRGKALRNSESMTDSSKKPKVYHPGLEVHDMGERFASALWLGRKKITNTEEYDHLIIDAVKDISRNPFATGHGFKEAFLARVNYTYDSQTAKAIQSIWSYFVPGEDQKVTDTSFLQSRTSSNAAWGLRASTKFPESVARDLGLSGEEKRFVYIRSEKTDNNFEAHLIASRDEKSVTPYWILIDPVRKNALGGWRLDGSKIQTEKEIDEVKTLVSQILTLEGTLTDFISKAKMFSDLASGKGDLVGAYKIKEEKLESNRLEFNGSLVEVKTKTLVVHRRMIARILGVPQIKEVSIITSSQVKMDSRWPSLNAEPVIGIKLKLEDGTISETILELIQ